MNLISKGLKSRYNLEFTCCNSMDFPPEKIAFLPLMFETIRIPVTDNVSVNGLKIIGQNSGSIILSNIAVVIQQTSSASFLSLSIHVTFKLIFSIIYCKRCV